MVDRPIMMIANAALTLGLLCSPWKVADSTILLMAAREWLRMQEPDLYHDGISKLAPRREKMH